MGLDFLLLLQDFRESAGMWLAPFMSWITEFSASFWPVAAICLIYWAFDRRGGRRILAGYAGGLFINGFLKLTFCVYRPWIRDARIQPYGDSKTAATGYSFPSGHSTRAAATMGGMGWQQRKRRAWVTALAAIYVLLVMFSRNFLGVHTPEDVIVGCVSTVGMMALTGLIENWSDKKPSRDWLILAATAAVCVAAALYYVKKPYPMDYNEAGKLLVNPVSMRADAYEGLGFLLAFSICRPFERRWFDFDLALSTRARVVVGIAALVPLYAWFNCICPAIMSGMGRAFGKLLRFSVITAYVMLFVPFVMKLVSGWLKKR